MNSDLLYDSPNIVTPFHTNIRIIFADDTASGRPCKVIDNMLTKEVVPYYSNTHSNAYTGILMKNLIKNTKNKIRQTYNLANEHKIIFSGNGTTSAINHLVNSINFGQYKKTNIFISMFEHYSNHLPWIEKSKDEKNIAVSIIPIKDNLIDFDWLDKYIENDCEVLNIVTITACSNVTGIITDLDKVKQIVSTHNSKEGNHVLLFIDCACLAPHENIDMNMIDAAFISMHKFVGGPSSPGILIAKQKLFSKSHPYNPGGGCVKKANAYTIQYDDDLEKKETAGTPNILGIIRINYVLCLREQYYEYMVEREKKINIHVHNELNKIKKSNSNIKVILLGQYLNQRIPLICISIENMHYNLIVALMNDLFGIQTRGGISCNGMLGEYIKNNYQIDGWCRITFSWLMTNTEIDYILSAIKFIGKHGLSYKSMYKYDKTTNLFTYDDYAEYVLTL